MHLAVALALDPATRTVDSIFAAARCVHPSALSFVRVELETVSGTAGTPRDVCRLAHYTPLGVRLGWLGLGKQYDDPNAAYEAADLYNGPEANEVLNDTPKRAEDQ